MWNKLWTGGITYVIYSLRLHSISYCGIQWLVQAPLHPFSLPSYNCFQFYMGKTNLFPLPPFLTPSCNISMLKAAGFSWGLLCCILYVHNMPGAFCTSCIYHSLTRMYVMRRCFLIFRESFLQSVPVQGLWLLLPAHQLSLYPSSLINIMFAWGQNGYRKSWY